MRDFAVEDWAPDEGDERPSLAGQLVGRLTLAAALLVLAGGLVAVGLRLLPAEMSKPPAPPPPPWVDIVKPVQIYHLEAPALAGAPIAYTAKRHTAGGGREDVMTFGALDGVKPGLRLRLFRRAEEAPLALPLYAALAHEAAQAGLSISRSSLPTLLPTRFGKFEYEELSLAPSEGTEAPCGGFRLVLDKPALTIAGLACGKRAAPLTKADVGCLIERLDVAAARDDRDLIEFFAKAELRRNAACTGMRMGPDTLHAAWLDDQPAQAKATRAVARDDDKPATTRKRVRRR